MKKLLTVFTAAITLSACNKVDKTDSIKKDFLTTGKWFLKDIIYEQTLPDTQTFYLISSYPSCALDDFYQFNIDGSGAMDAGLALCNNEPQRTVISWTLKENGSKLTLYKTDSMAVITVLKLDDSILELKYPYKKENSSGNYTTIWGH